MNRPLRVAEYPWSRSYYHPRPDWIDFNCLVCGHKQYAAEDSPIAEIKHCSECDVYHVTGTVKTTCSKHGDFLAWQREDDETGELVILGECPECVNSFEYKFNQFLYRLKRRVRNLFDKIFKLRTFFLCLFIISLIAFFRGLHSAGDLRWATKMQYFSIYFSAAGCCLGVVGFFGRKKIFTGLIYLSIIALIWGLWWINVPYGLVPKLPVYLFKGGFIGLVVGIIGRYITGRH